VKVYWTARAEARLEAIYNYISRDNPAAALRVVQQVLRRSEQIATHPESGRCVPDYEREDVRELIENQYRIVYRIMPGRIDVLTVMHAAKLLPSDLKRLP
jgi:addiction module RelE/StbE family toxin